MFLLRKILIPKTPSISWHWDFLTGNTPHFLHYYMHISNLNVVYSGSLRTFGSPLYSKTVLCCIAWVCNVWPSRCFRLFLPLCDWTYVNKWEKKRQNIIFLQNSTDTHFSLHSCSNTLGLWICKTRRGGVMGWEICREEGKRKEVGESDPDSVGCSAVWVFTVFNQLPCCRAFWFTVFTFTLLFFYYAPRSWNTHSHWSAYGSL